MEDGDVLLMEDGDVLLWAEAVGLVVPTQALPRAHVIEVAQLGTCQAALCGVAPEATAAWMRPEEARVRMLDEERPPCDACFKAVNKLGGAS